MKQAQGYLCNIEAEEVERMVDGLDFEHFRQPHSQILRGCHL